MAQHRDYGDESMTPDYSSMTTEALINLADQQLDRSGMIGIDLAAVLMERGISVHELY